MRVYINTKETVGLRVFSLVDCRTRAHSLIVATFRYATVFLVQFFFQSFSISIVLHARVLLRSDRLLDRFLMVVALVVFVVA